jgi:hypothetical protein
MENKKLLKYLLKDLSELEEMFTESGKNSFDELEMEFIQSRVAGAKRLVRMFLEHVNDIPAAIKTDSPNQNKTELHQLDFSGGKTGVWPEETNPEIKPVEKSTEITENLKAPGIVIQESKPEVATDVEMPEKVIEIEDEIKIQEPPVEAVPKNAAKVRPVAVQQELQLEDEEPADIHNKRLGDLFSKEKSVNDLMSDDISKLEHKLSNRPVTSLQSAIGINDRFQYIRELFEGSVDDFVKTVADLDSMNDMKDAVDYLQTNFKWKKNETSLKFVNLIKRRFPHE